MKFDDFLYSPRYRRLLKWATAFNASSIVLGIYQHSIIGIVVGSVGVFAAVVWLFTSKGMSKINQIDEYASISKDIETMTAILPRLSNFIEQERKKVSTAEATLRQLHAEKDELEPVVSLQRTSIESVLTAYTKSQSSGAWRYHLIGFFLGITASLLAALIWDLFTKSK